MSGREQEDTQAERASPGPKFSYNRSIRHVHAAATASFADGGPEKGIATSITTLSTRGGSITTGILMGHEADCEGPSRFSTMRGVPRAGQLRRTIWQSRWKLPGFQRMTVAESDSAVESKPAPVVDHPRI